jgi:hypothetical protein
MLIAVLAIALSVLMLTLALLIRLEMTARTGHMRAMWITMPSARIHTAWRYAEKPRRGGGTDGCPPVGAVAWSICPLCRTCSPSDRSMAGLDDELN